MREGNDMAQKYRRGFAWLLMMMLWVSWAASSQSKDALGQSSSTSDKKLKDFRAVYQMRRQGEFWANAVVNLTSIKYQGQEAYRHAIAMHFETETVFDETLFTADDFTLLAKFIHAGFGEDLSWRLYTQKNEKIIGAHVFANGKKPQTFDKALTQTPSGNALLFLAQMNLEPEKTHTFWGTEHDIEYNETIRVVDQSSFNTEQMTIPKAWQLELKNALMPNHTTEVWLTTEPPYLLKKSSPEAAIEWVLQQYQVF